MTLKNLNNNSVITNKLIEAKGFAKRVKGLIGISELDFILWIKRCNSIHTFFMKIPIDAVFVNESLLVKKIYKNLKPWRVIWPMFGVSSVFEMNVGVSDRISVGDKLYVGN